MNIEFFYSILDQWEKYIVIIKNTKIHISTRRKGNLQRGFANEWGLTKHYMIPLSTIVGRFANRKNMKRQKGKTNNTKKYISLSSLHISWL